MEFLKFFLYIPLRKTEPIIYLKLLMIVFYFKDKLTNYNNWIIYLINF